MSKSNQKTPEQNRADYERAEPKQFGNLHERMKYLVQLANELERSAIDLKRSNDAHDTIVWNACVAIHDLETEVKSHTPDEPPHGTRVVKL